MHTHIAFFLFAPSSSASIDHCQTLLHIASALVEVRARVRREEHGNQVWVPSRRLENDGHRVSAPNADSITNANPTAEKSAAVDGAAARRWAVQTGVRAGTRRAPDIRHGKHKAVFNEQRVHAESTEHREPPKKQRTLAAACQWVAARAAEISRAPETTPGRMQATSSEEQAAETVPSAVGARGAPRHWEQASAAWWRC